MASVAVTVFQNCRILRNGAFEACDIWVQDGRIVSAQDMFYAKRIRGSRFVDCGGRILSPGFIDVQINGGFGEDFSSGPASDLAEAVAKVGQRILEHGVVAFCPTIITSAPQEYAARVPQIARRPGGKQGAAVLGLHLEGPFICPAKKGAHPEQHIRTFPRGPTDVAEVYGTDLSNVQIVTLAPELENAPEVVADLVSRDIVVSLGHSCADIEHGRLAVARGARMITHLFNAMQSFHHRDPGLVGLLADAPPEGLQQPGDEPYGLYYGLIVDGFHTHTAALRIAHATHPEGCVLVTDAIAALGLGPGRHALGEMVVDLDEHNKCTLKDKPDTLAGSAASMDFCVRNFAKLVGTAAALEAATLHPARALHMEKERGTLNPGSVADFVLLSDDLRVQSTIIAGEIVYSAPGVKLPVDERPDNSAQDSQAV
eukprot:m.9379 g.9379  ORF g.9379 m.9379 type:complete len:428 (-) comp2967_c0_seq1:56-1339(-)